MTYLPDPGGQFASDVHRRVTAALPEGKALDADGLLQQLGHDSNVPFDPERSGSDAELEDVLKELEGEGLASSTKDGWKGTKAGFELLTGPNADEPPPLEGDELERVEAENEEHRKRTAARAAEGRIENYRAQLEEIQEAIDRDEKIVEEAS
jgi:hypothetical protein